jgi:taurine dioxygenase
MNLARGGNAMSNSLTVTRLSGALGAEIGGVDLAHATDAEIAAIRRIWLDHNVVFFRDQALPPADFLALAKRIGTPIEYPFVKGIDGFSEIIPVLKLPNERVNFGGIWHSDTTYLDQPPMATLLVAREVPDHGGDTLFANMYLAYEALSGGMKRLLDGLRFISSSAKADVSRTREDRIKDSARADAKQLYEATHPVVRTHPETGRKALYVNIAHALRFEDMTPEESAPLLDWLCQHATRPEFTCRFRWTPGAVALWDNRCTLHNPVNDYHGQLRSMHRITLAGDVPK